MGEEASSLGVLVMAAGKGTRMHSERPKVLQSLLEEPVLYYILDAVKRAGLSNVAVLVGHRGDMVEAYLRSEWPDVQIIWQREQLGTGHAVKVCEDWWKGFNDLLVLNGDVPLVRAKTIQRLVAHHMAHAAQCSIISVNSHDPSGYGRIVRLADGGVRIVEQKEATEDELAIHEINAGIYLFETETLSSVVSHISPNNEQHEYYITDAIHLISDTAGEVNVIVSDDENELLGVNTPCDLAMTARRLNDSIVRGHMLRGLKCIDPSSTWIGPRVELEPDVFIEPGVSIWGRSKIGTCSRIGAHTTLRNVTIGRSTTVVGPSVVTDSTVGDNAVVGPFAYLRDGALLKDGSRAGRFVEIKNSSVGSGAKVPHLSYIGDATIGDGTNIGAGTITCNYDGETKHSTTIGNDCFVGSDTMFVAPVSMGDGASTAAGSVITSDIPAGSLGVGRAKQKNIDGWNEKKHLMPSRSEAKEN